MHRFHLSFQVSIIVGHYLLYFNNNFWPLDIDSLQKFHTRRHNVDQGTIQQLTQRFKAKESDGISVEPDVEGKRKLNCNAYQDLVIHFYVNKCLLSF